MINRITALIVVGMLMLWTYHFFHPVTHKKQLHKIAQALKNQETTYMMLDHKKYRWIFIVFSDKELENIEKNKLNAFSYRWISAEIP